MQHFIILHLSKKASFILYIVFICLLLINYFLSDSDSIVFKEMRIVHGRPRHPQTQGLIERANAILTDALGK